MPTCHPILHPGQSEACLPPLASLSGARSQCLEHLCLPPYCHGEAPKQPNLAPMYKEPHPQQHSEGTPEATPVHLWQVPDGGQGCPAELLLCSGAPGWLCVWTGDCAAAVRVESGLQECYPISGPGLAGGTQGKESRCGQACGPHVLPGTGAFNEPGMGGEHRGGPTIQICLSPVGWTYQEGRKRWWALHLWQHRSPVSRWTSG